MMDTPSTPQSVETEIDPALADTIEAAGLAGVSPAKAMRLYREIAAETIAPRLGMTVARLVAIEAGEAPTPIERLALAEALDVSPDLFDQFGSGV